MNYMQVGKAIPLPCEDILSSVEKMLREEHLSADARISTVLTFIGGWRALGMEDQQPTPMIATTGTRVTWVRTNGQKR